MRHVVAEEWNVECEGHGEGRRQGWNKRTRAKVVALVRFDPLHNFASTPNSVPGTINFVPLRSGPHPFLVGLGATVFAFSAPSCPPTKMRVVGRAFCPPSTREGRSGTCCSAVAATAATAAAAAVAAAAATAAAAVAVTRLQGWRCRSVPGTARHESVVGGQIEELAARVRGEQNLEQPPQRLWCRGSEYAEGQRKER